MKLFRILQHKHGSSSAYIKDTNTGRPLELPEDKADKYITWLNKMNGKSSSLLVLEETNERSDVDDSRSVGTA